MIGGLFPGYMDAFAVCEKPAVPCGVVALECQIALGVAHLMVGILHQDIFERKLLSCCQIRMRRFYMT